MKKILLAFMTLACFTCYGQNEADMKFYEGFAKIKSSTVAQNRLVELQGVYKDLGALNLPWDGNQINYDRIISIPLSKERLWHRIKEVCAITYGTEIGYEDTTYGRMVYYGKLKIKNKASFWPSWIDMISEINFSARFFIKDGAIKIEMFDFGAMDLIYPIIMQPNIEQMKDAHRVSKRFDQAILEHLAGWEIWLKSTEEEDKFFEP